MHVIDQSGKWAIELGSALLAFGAVEHALDMCIGSAVIEEKSKKTIKSLLFSSRAAQFIKTIQDKEHAAQLINHLIDAIVAGRTRNKITHNPIVLRIYEDSDGFTLAKEILRDKKSESIEFEEL